MFYVIKNNMVYECADRISRAFDYPDMAKELVGVDVRTFDENRDKYAIIEDTLVDISETEEYKKKIQEQAKQVRIAEIKSALNNLDLKCIRALREGGNDENGIPFLEKYQNEISTLRDELNSL